MVPIPEAEAKVTETKVEDGKLNPITRQFFLEHIFDYRKGNDFVYNGDKPVVIDFWATWCGPCMRLLPEMEKLAEKYKGKVVFYKVNADKERIYAITSVYRHCLPYSSYLQAANRLLKSELLRRSTYKSSKSNY